MNPAPSHRLDIGNYIGIPSIDDMLKEELLQNCWSPPSDYKMPFSTHTKQGREEKRFFSHKYLVQFPWLAFSHEKSGLFCKYCVLFPQQEVGSRQQNRVNRFVSVPLRNFSKLTGKDGAFTLHSSREYHQTAVCRAMHFLKIRNSTAKDILSQISKSREKAIQDNRERLVPIIETILLCGRQNIPLRGHRDDGNFMNDNSSDRDGSTEMDTVVKHNEGNFRELLKYRINAGDQTLAKHLQTVSSRATYISKTTQNDIIETIGTIIEEKICNKVKRAGIYSVMFDETTDVSNKEQMTLCVRYLDDEEKRIQENFLRILDCHADNYNGDPESMLSTEPVLSGKVLSETVERAVTELKLPLDKCVGIGTDGTSSMTSSERGAAAMLATKMVNATHTVCPSHGLNLSLGKMSKVVSVRNAVSTVQQVIVFFGASAKRNAILKSALQLANARNNSQLINLCETRWVERHDSIILFQSVLGTIVRALKAISE